MDSLIGFFLFLLTGSFLTIGFVLFHLETSENYVYYRKPIDQNKLTYHSEGEKKIGYMLTYQVKEQLTCGAANLLSQTCLASKINESIRFVEPFLKTSYFGFPLTVFDFNATDQEEPLTFFDIYDKKQWQEVVHRQHFRQMATWQEFLENAPRDYIVVIDNWGETSNHEEFIRLLDSHLSPNGFRLKRIAHKDFKKTGVLSLDDFKNLIYGQDNPEEVTVIFDEFGGITKTEVTRYMESINVDCEKKNYYGNEFNFLNTSNKVKSDAEKYIKNYLNNQYISVMLRSEHIIKDKKSSLNKIQIIEKCLDKTQEYISMFKNNKNINNIFLAMDTGKFGSAGYITGFRRNELATFELLEKFVPRVFNESMSFVDWENSFEDITGTVMSGYIAILQKEIALRGECLILVGRGQFHQHAYNLFMARNTDKDPCIIRLDQDCNEY